MFKSSKVIDSHNDVYHKEIKHMNNLFPFVANRLLSNGKTKDCLVVSQSVFQDGEDVWPVFIYLDKDAKGDFGRDVVGAFRYKFNYTGKIEDYIK